MVENRDVSRSHSPLSLVSAGGSAERRPPPRTQRRRRPARRVVTPHARAWGQASTQVRAPTAVIKPPSRWVNVVDGSRAAGRARKTAAGWAAGASTASRPKGESGGRAALQQRDRRRRRRRRSARAACPREKHGGANRAVGAVEGTAAATPSPGALASTAAGWGAVTSHDRRWGAKRPRRRGGMPEQVVASGVRGDGRVLTPRHPSYPAGTTRRVRGGCTPPPAPMQCNSAKDRAGRPVSRRGTLMLVRRRAYPRPPQILTWRWPPPTSLSGDAPSPPAALSDEPRQGVVQVVQPRQAHRRRLAINAAVEERVDAVEQRAEVAAARHGGAAGSRGRIARRGSHCRRRRHRPCRRGCGAVRASRRSRRRGLPHARQPAAGAAAASHRRRQHVGRDGRRRQHLVGRSRRPLRRRRRSGRYQRGGRKQRCRHAAAPTAAADTCGARTGRRRRGWCWRGRWGAYGRGEGGSRRRRRKRRR